MPEPKIAQKKPYVMKMKVGTYFFCTCGESLNQPFCDGSHTIEKDFSPLKVDLDEDKTVAFCGCKHSKNGAFCDGTHNTL